MVGPLNVPRLLLAPVSRKRGLIVAIWLAGLVLLPASAALKPQGRVALAAEEQPSSASAIDIEMKHGFLAVDARNAPLADLLLAIGRRSGIRVVIEGDLGPSLTTSFEGLTVEKAIKRLLRNSAYTTMVMVYARSSGETEPGPLAEVLIYTAEGTAVVATEGPRETTSAEDLDTRLQTLRSLSQPRGEDALNSLTQVLSEDDDPVVRAHAAVGLGDLGGDQAVSALAAAVVDEDRSVRRNAIRGLGMTGGHQAARALAQALTEDSVPQNRLLAVRALGKLGIIEEPWWALEAAATSDADVKVSTAAVMVLQQWDPR